MPYIRTILCCYHMHNYTCYICVWCICCTCFLLFSDPPARIKIYNFAGSLTRGFVKTCTEIPFQSTKKALTSASPECTMEPPERSTCGPRCVLSGAHDDCRPKVESHEWNSTMGLRLTMSKQNVGPMITGGQKKDPLCQTRPLDRGGSKPWGNYHGGPNGIPWARLPTARTLQKIVNNCWRPKMKSHS